MVSLCKEQQRSNIAYLFSVAHLLILALRFDQSDLSKLYKLIILETAFPDFLANQAIGHP